MSDSAKLKHLELLQNLIVRIAGHSFYLKGWSVALVVGILVLAGKDGNPHLIPVAYLPAIVFWFLDAYFLRQERMLRRLYDAVRTTPPDEVDFSMDVSAFSKDKSIGGYLLAMFSITLGWFHGILVVAVTLVYMWS